MLRVELADGPALAAHWPLLQTPWSDENGIAVGVLFSADSVVGCAAIGENPVEIATTGSLALVEH